MNAIQNLDIFGVPFQFNVNGKSKTNKTTIGGIIFIIIMILSIIYFCYQNYLYFSDNISPKATITTVPLKELEQFIIPDELIAFEIVMDRDLKLSAHQKKVNKVFVDYVVTIVTVSKAGVAEVAIGTKDCTDPKLKGYLCLDLSKQEKPLTLDYNPNFSGAWQKNLKLQIVRCENRPECATKQEIDDLLLQVRVQFQIVSRFLQFNYKTQEFESTYKLDIYGFDSDLSFYSNLNLTKTNYKIQKGFMVLKEELSSGITSTDLSTQYKTSIFLQSKLNKYVYGILVFYLFDKIEEVEVVYPLYSETFAQFASIFGMLMVLGNIAKIFSEIGMYESITNVFLQEQFKNTSYQYIVKQNQNSSNQVNPQKDTQKRQQKYSHSLSRNLDMIKQTDAIQSIRSQQKKKSFKEKIMKSKAKEVDPEESKIKLLKDQTIENISIVDMYRNIVQMKLMLRMLVTKEQYSAIKFCGMNLDTIVQKKLNLIAKEEKLNPKSKTNKRKTSEEQHKVDDDTQKKASNKDNESILNEDIEMNKIHNEQEDQKLKDRNQADNQENVNHLEKLEIIDMDKDELVTNLNKFLTDFETQKAQDGNIDPISQRIVNCLFIPPDQLNH